MGLKTNYTNLFVHTFFVFGCVEYFVYVGLSVSGCSRVGESVLSKLVVRRGLYSERMVLFGGNEFVCFERL